MRIFLNVFLLLFILTLSGVAQDSAVQTQQYLYVKCASCKGHGNLYCSFCQSRDLTKETCSHCKGRDLRIETCSNCRGRDLTLETCSNCRGRDLTTETCFQCKGKGRKIDYFGRLSSCFYCKGTGHKLECFYCDGRGKKSACFYCSGTGKKSECFYCSGTGKKSQCFYCNGAAASLCNTCTGEGVVLASIIESKRTIFTTPFVAENGSYYGQLNNNGVPKTVYVNGYYRKEGTYVRSHFRSPPYSNPTYKYERSTGKIQTGVAENGSYYGEPSKLTGRPKTVHVKGYYRKDGTYVRGHYRSKPRK